MGHTLDQGLRSMNENHLDDSSRPMSTYTATLINQMMNQGGNFKRKSSINTTDYRFNLTQVT